MGRRGASFRLSYCKGDNLTQNLLPAGKNTIPLLER